MMNHPDMYVKAKDSTEPIFCNILNSMPNVTAWLADDKDDYINHTDVYAAYKDTTYAFDVKDVTEQYRNGLDTNYCISQEMMNDITHHPDKYKHHKLACVEYSGKKPTGKYVTMKTLDVIGHVTRRTTRVGHKTFYTFSLRDISSKISCKTLS